MTFLKLIRDAREAVASGNPEAMLNVAIAILLFIKDFLYGGGAEVLSVSDKSAIESELNSLEEELNSPTAQAAPILIIGRIILALLPILRDIIKK